MEKFIGLYSVQQKQNLAKMASLLELRRKQNLAKVASLLERQSLANYQVDSPESVMAKVSKPIIDAGHKLLRK